MRYFIVALGILFLSFTSTAAPGSFNLLTPSAGQLLDDVTDLPAITWQASTGAVAYEVSLRMIAYEQTPWLTVQFVSGMRVNVPVEGVIYTFTLFCDSELCLLPIPYPIDLSPFYDWDGRYEWNVTAVDAQGGRTPSANGPLKFRVDVPEPDLLVNPSFEDDANIDGIPDGWFMVRRSNDGQICGQLQRSGNCAFLFRGSPTETANLRQNINFSGLTLAKDDYLELVVWYHGINRGSNARAVLVVDYVNPNVANSVLILPMRQTLAYRRIAGYLPLKNGNVQQIFLRIENRTPGGRFLLDDISVTHTNAPTP